MHGRSAAGWRSRQERSSGRRRWWAGSGGVNRGGNVRRNGCLRQLVKLDARGHRKAVQLGLCVGGWGVGGDVGCVCVGGGGGGGPDGFWR